MSTNAANILEVSNLKTHFFTEEGIVQAVDGVDFTVREGEILGIVGESGCGKSVTSYSIMGLVSPPGRVIDGRVLFDDRNLLELSEREMDRLRGDRISMIFQQPHSALNPVYSVGEQVAEVLHVHKNEQGKNVWQETIELLRLVGIPDPESKARAYPHELSGGQAQRVMIAIALAMQPQLLIADEPTTALDVTIQAQILDLIRELRRRLGTAVILITHDLGVIAEMADRVAVMYAGQIVEQADVKTLFREPKHPYTKGLIRSIPVLGHVTERLDTIPGVVPQLIDLPMGCRFADRCEARVEHELEICARQTPPLAPTAPTHNARCWLYHDAPGHEAPLVERNRAAVGS